MQELALHLAVVIAGRGAREKATRLLERYDFLARVLQAPETELRALGLGPAQARRLVSLAAVLKGLSRVTTNGRAVVRTAQDVYERFHCELRGLEREVFITVLMDGKNHVIREERVSVGSLTSSIVHPREVFSMAIRERADGVVFVHNHPSGDPTPSLEDLEITRRLVDVGRLVGIRVLDHIVIGEGEFASFSERGLLDPS